MVCTFSNEWNVTVQYVKQLLEKAEWLWASKVSFSSDHRCVDRSHTWEAT